MSDPGADFPGSPENQTEARQDQDLPSQPEVAPTSPPAPVSEIEFHRQLPEDLRAPWGWSDLVVFIAFAFVALFVLQSLLLFAASPWLSIHSRDSQMLPIALAAFGGLLVLTCLIAFATTSRLADAANKTMPLLAGLLGFFCMLLFNSGLTLAAMAWFGLKQTQVTEFLTTNTAFISVRQTLWYALLMLYLFGVVRLRYRRPFWRTIGWRELRRGFLPAPAAYAACVMGGVVLALGVEFASVFVRTKTTLPIEALFHERQSVLWLMAMGILLAPVVEETIFRGYIYPVLGRSLGVTGGVLATGLLFGLMHAQQLWGGWGQIALLVGVGVVLTYVRARTRTVTASFLLHLGYNSFLFAGFYFYTGGLRHFPPGP